MSPTAAPGDVEAETSGEALHALVAELYPICRSITGDGVRETLRRIARRIPLTVHEVPTGTPVFDWTVPREWNIQDAYVKNAAGERVIDFRRSNLHVMSYSVPVRARMSLEDLRGHLFTLPDRPDWIPYRTSYYADRWGFCLPQRELDRLRDGEYDVCIDSTLAPGSLTYGECYLPGDSTDEVLLSCHVCHPSLANDNLSGVAVATFLAARLAARAARRYSYRFLFIPGTIGSITWLARNEAHVGNVKHGLVLACLGDAGRLTYKKSRRGTAEIDRAVYHVLKASGDDYAVEEFSPYGYDERQFCSPGFDLPVGCLMRTPHGRYPEYHTSADDLDLVRPDRLADSLDTLESIVAVLEANAVYVSQNPKCEPQLGKRGLYGTIGGDRGGEDELALLWVLNLADGRHTLLAVAERSGYPFEVVAAAARALVDHGLLKEAPGEEREP